MDVTFYTHTSSHKMAEHQSLLRPREANDDAFSSHRVASVVFKDVDESPRRFWRDGLGHHPRSERREQRQLGEFYFFDDDERNSIASSSGKEKPRRRPIIARVQNHQTAHGVRAVARARFPPRPDVVEEKHGRASDCSIATKSRVGVRSRD